MADAHHRRVYLVDRSFQLKYICVFMAWGAVLAALFGLWAHQAQAHAIEVAVRDPATRALLERAGRQLLWVLAGIGALSTAALGLVGFLFTHRVAGPAHVMAHVLALVAEGRYPPRRALRRNDELKKIHARLLETVEALKERDARHLELLDEATHRIRKALPRAPELAAVAEELEREASRRRAALDEAAGTAATPLPRRASA